MFPKNQRITEKKDFDLIFKKGKALNSPFLTVRILKNNLSMQRFAVLVSKKVSKKAVDRNKIKRILRESVKQKIKLFPAGSDAVLYVHPKFSGLSFNDGIKLLQKMLTKS